MNLEQKLEEAASNIQTSFYIPVRIVKPETHKCISCGFETEFKKGCETYDTVTEREQFFCYDCHNTATYVARVLRRPSRGNH